ncbi:MAG TPA: hypothetical protein DCP08_05125 [Chloroflexi bacterium]|nr:hypothetical protein [Chloroflexota bacterium]
MKRRIAPLQIGDLFKSIFLMLLLITILWAVTSLLLFRDILVSRPLLVMNLVLSLFLGWFFYRYYRHTIFIYDEEGFELRQGRRVVQGRWKEYSSLSLFHLGRGDFVVRLYRDEEEFLDLPASALRLDPSRLRFEVMKFMGKNPTGSLNEKRLDNFPAS